MVRFTIWILNSRRTCPSNFRFFVNLGELRKILKRTRHCLVPYIVIIEIFFNMLVITALIPPAIIVWGIQNQRNSK